MKTKVITENHPFMQRVNKLYDLMEELNITIEYGGCGALNFIDDETQQSYKLKDKDTGQYGPMFPTGIEFKLTYECDE